MDKKTEKIKYITYLKRKYNDNIVLINFEMIVSTSQGELEAKQNPLAGSFFKENELNNLVDFCKVKQNELNNLVDFYRVGIDSGVIMNEFIFVDIGWGKILAKGNDDIIKYFEDCNKIEDYFKFVHLPQLIEMRNIENFA